MGQLLCADKKQEKNEVVEELPPKLPGHTFQHNQALKEPVGIFKVNRKRSSILKSNETELLLSVTLWNHNPEPNPNPEVPSLTSLKCTLALSMRLKGQKQKHSSEVLFSKVTVSVYIAGGLK